MRSSPEAARYRSRVCSDSERRPARRRDPGPGGPDLFCLRYSGLGLIRAIARGLLRLGGWTVIGGKVGVPKAVIIAYPHTSNWDGLWALTYRVAVGLDLRFFGKHTLFWFPLGTLLRALGGIPLDRRTPGSAVEQAVQAFADNESFYFALAPEGTRRLEPYWKSGFYRIAKRANVPVVLGFMD